MKDEEVPPRSEHEPFILHPSCFILVSHTTCKGRQDLAPNSDAPNTRHPPPALRPLPSRAAASSTARTRRACSSVRPATTRATTCGSAVRGEPGAEGGDGAVSVYGGGVSV